MKIENGKRIAKNTLMLYFRMLITMGVTLYISRVVLNTLGAEDYGIYNVVGGVVAMLAFFNNSLSIATQRFFNVEMACGDIESLNKVFSTSVFSYFIIVVIILVIAETVGLWFVKTQLTIPVDRIDAAIWVYQFSIFTFIINILSTPYNAAIIAHEQMSIFAYISIIEVLLKLFTAFLFIYVMVDKLILYAFLLLLISFLIRCLYVIYCRSHFEECKFHFVKDKRLLNKIFSFSGWMLTGTLASALNTQGINVLLNIFFGPICNAARGIAYQLQGAILAFIQNFMTAVQPQIMKLYSKGNIVDMTHLVYGATKYSFFLLLLLALPVLANTKFVLQIWLHDVPDNTLIFTRLIIIDSLINILFIPLGTITQASGRIKFYQIVVSLCFISVFIFSFVAFVLGYPSYYAFLISIFVNVLGLFFRLLILHKYYDFDIFMYMKNVLVRIIIVGLACILLSFFIHFAINFYIKFVDKWSIFFSSVFLNLLVVFFCCWILGFSLDEKRLIKSKIKLFIKNRF